MITTRVIAERFRLLGFLRALVVQEAFESLYSGEEPGGEHSKSFQDYLEGALLALSEVGLETTASAIIPHMEKHDEFAEFILENTILDKSLAPQVADQFGKVAYFNFLLSQAITCVRLLSSFRWATLKGTPARRRPLVQSQREIAHEALTVISTFLVNADANIKEYLGASFQEQCQTLAMALLKARRTTKRFQLAYDLTASLLNNLIPHFDEIKERQDRARELISELRACPSGRVSWSQYENICIKCIRFLFLPPFKNLLIQKRTADNHERRDAILTNNQHEGFWRLIREEFSSRHIVCEFKNKDRGLSKADLNQLRIYLLRPTIGRFGLLFVRKGSSESLQQAQRNAYEQTQVLILVINDRMLESMMKLRTFTGRAEHILEVAKIKFEVEY